MEALAKQPVEQLSRHNKLRFWVAAEGVKPNLILTYRSLKMDHPVTQQR